MKITDLDINDTVRVTKEIQFYKKPPKVGEVGAVVQTCKRDTNPKPVVIIEFRRPGGVVTEVYTQEMFDEHLELAGIAHDRWLSGRYNGIDSLIYKPKIKNKHKEIKKNQPQKTDQEKETNFYLKDIAISLRVLRVYETGHEKVVKEQTDRLVYALSKYLK